MSDGALARVVEILLGRIIRPGERRAILRAEADALPYAESKRQEAKDIELAETLRRVELLSEGRNLRMVIEKAVEFMGEGQEECATRAFELVDEGWLHLFRQYSRAVAAEDIQSVFAKVLAGELQSPGSFSKRALNFLSLLGKNEAEVITLAGKFAFSIEGRPFHFTRQGVWPLMRAHGWKPAMDRGMRALGLTDAISDQIVAVHAKKYPIDYFDRRFWLKLKATYGEVSVGVGYYSEVASELLPICGATPDWEFYEAVKELLAATEFRVWEEGEAEPER